MPKVSVILPTYNCARYLQESIDSVLSQDLKDKELIVVDDGSTDDTKQAVSRYSAHPEVVYLHQEHGGLPAARNAGLKRAAGEHISFIDADDIYLPGRLSRQAAILDSDRRTDIVYTAWRYFYDGDKDHGMSSPYAKLSGDILFFLKRSNFIPIVTAMVRRSSLGDVRFDDTLKSHEDWDLWLKLAGKGKTFRCIDEELTMIRVRKSSMTYERSVMDASRNIVGQRARDIWRETKRADLLRYMKLRAAAFIINFPAGPEFNKALPFDKGPTDNPPCTECASH
jgi:glycosyltransferase involved in cell wall biosynthesis